MVDHYLEKAKEPDFEIDQIRKELEIHGVDDEEIRVITYLVDNEIQKNMLNSAATRAYNSAKIAGFALLIIGLAVFLLTGNIFIGTAVSTGGGGLIAYGRNRS